MILLFGYDIIALRWGIGIVVFFLIAWFVLARRLLKSEPREVKTNMANRYKEITIDELEKYDIDYYEFKKMVYKKFVDIHEALTNKDKEKLKINLTDDLYNYYIEELEKSKNKNYTNVMKDFDFVNFKIYNIDDMYGLLKVDIYLNVKMIDYIIDFNTSEYLKGNDKDKIDLEYELTFIKYGNGNNMYDNYLLSKKSCVNEMLIVDKDVYNKTKN